jgi:predicted lipid-binding transport protein (Tim44 family)
MPQFGKLEPSAASSNSCKLCKQTITGPYYRAHGNVVCGSCADRVKREQPQDSHAAFVRGLLFGLVGALLGLVLYASFTIITGFEIGIVSLVVGLIIGKAMIVGSRGIGGRRYQIAAVLLTYGAVSLASIPIAIHYFIKHRPGTPAVVQQQKQAAAGENAQPQAEPNPAAESRPAPASKPPLHVAGLMGRLAMIGLASPFLQLAEGASGFIGLIILFVGIQFAWKITAGRVSIAVDGPYQLSSSASA